MSGRLCIVTMGCKVNLADSAAFAGIASALGWEITGAEADADLFLLNTCTVTGKTDAEARQIVRRLHRASPRAKVVVAGCLPRAGIPLGAEFEDYCMFVREQGGEALVRALEGAVRIRKPAATDGLPPECTTAGLAGRTRPFLKIQDGCDSACAYCIVPRARGRSRSVPFDQAIGGLDRLLKCGHREVVLVGVHLGQYGKDIAGGLCLARFLDAASRLDGIRDGARIRLTSLEPAEVTGELLDFISGHGFICPHFHIPLQSGSDGILVRMNRPYGTDLYLRAVEALKASSPDSCIGADVISGFPGETERDHRDTVKFISSAPVDYLHVFRFSRRPGTAAESMPGGVAPKTVSERVSELRALGEEKRRRFRESMCGRVLQALVEGRSGDGWSGLTGNYIRTRIEGPDLKRGALVDIVLGGERGGGVERGRPESVERSR
jgi:threonylcarbamoyladenosine tRNA methylthiotransferase MtaB